MILPKNGLHKGTACLIRAVLTMSQERGCPYVTYRNAARALVAGKRARWDGGSWQRRMGETYCYRLKDMPGPEYRESLWAFAAGVQS